MARRMVKKSPLYDLIVIGLLATMGVSCVGCGESERPEGADHTNFSSGPANASAFAPDVGARLASNIDDQSSPAGKPQDVSSLQSMSGHGKLQKQKSDTSSGVLVSHKAESEGGKRDRSDIDKMGSFGLCFGDATNSAGRSWWNGFSRFKSRRGANAVVRESGRLPSIRAGFAEYS